MFLARAVCRSPAMAPRSLGSVPTWGKTLLSGGAVRHKHAPPTTPLTETVREFLEPAEFYSALRERHMDFFTGVPDSLLKDFCAYVTDHAPKENHVITANEGASVGMAAGYYLATRKFPVVYMQNSGFGNAVNPLLSLTDPQVYGIPMLLLIGWRGEPGKRDEPQHIVQGKVMSPLLTDMNINFEVLPDYKEGAEEVLDTALHYMENRSAPFALLVKRQCFEPYALQTDFENNHTMTREGALDVILSESDPWDAFVSTTGFSSREVYELREKKGQDHRRDFLTVGSMGHAPAIALGIALGKPSRQTYCLDGDGGLLMHMGTMCTAGVHGPKNFKHILINNGVHDSVGGQPSVGFDVNFCDIAAASGYKTVLSCDNEADLKKHLHQLRQCDGPAFLEVKTNKGARKDLGRPKEKPRENKREFMRFLDG